MSGQWRFCRYQNVHSSIIRQTGLDWCRISRTESLIKNNTGFYGHREWILRVWNNVFMKQELETCGEVPALFFSESGSGIAAKKSRLRNRNLFCQPAFAGCGYMPFDSEWCVSPDSPHARSHAVWRNKHVEPFCSVCAVVQAVSYQNPSLSCEDSIPHRIANRQ